jgi:hypothetical protein
VSVKVLLVIGFMVALREPLGRCVAENRVSIAAY